MTLDEILVTVCTAIQPFADVERQNPRAVEELIGEIKKVFVEEPLIEEAFKAAVMSIATAARIGWTRNDD